jgi:hypothetical protein
VTIASVGNGEEGFFVSRKGCIANAGTNLRDATLIGERAILADFPQMQMAVVIASHDPLTVTGEGDTVQTVRHGLLVSPLRPVDIPDPKEVGLAAVVDRTCDELAIRGHRDRSTHLPLHHWNGLQQMAVDWLPKPEHASAIAGHERLAVRRKCGAPEDTLIHGARRHDRRVRIRKGCHGGAIFRVVDGDIPRVVC